MPRVFVAIVLATSAATAQSPAHFASGSTSAAHTSSLQSARGALLPVVASSPDGWTTFQASADTRIVYVSSSSGDDANDGLAPAQAKRTLAAAKSLLRHGYPDWMLLRRGDVWYEGLGQWKTSGRSVSEPMLVATYGSATARPLLLTGASGGVWTEGGSQSPATIDNLALVGLHLRPAAFSGYGDCVGARMLQPGSHFLIEDCKFEGFSTNLVFQGFGGIHHDFMLRRSVIVDAFNVHGSGAHPQGLYAYAVHGLRIEQCVFDHNGWNAAVAGAEPDMFSHNVYIDNDNTGVFVRGNIIANAASHGMQLRCGGTVIDNLFVRNSIALSVGGGNNPEPAGVLANVLGNVILDGKDIDASNPRGWGVWLANIAQGNVLFNVIANNTLGKQPAFVTLDGNQVGDTHASVGVHDLSIGLNVIHNWGGSMVVDGNAAQINGVRLFSTDVQDSAYSFTLLEHIVPNSTLGIDSWSNRFFASHVPVGKWAQLGTTPAPIGVWMAQVGDSSSVVQQAAYKDPTRSPASYNATLGGAASLDAFLAAARQQSFTSWNPSYLAAAVDHYVRIGFLPLGH
ncbi:MAG: right-handed parallel beta-helix repeat-containing protein [Planctomycetota bacterium]|nr:MAG: right-handed parallel beta-helix repeat-containing protein [Planctomycetota bacterium]